MIKVIKMKIVYKIIILLIMTFIFIYPVIGDDNSSTRKPVTYVTLVDKTGFYKVYNAALGRTIPYQNNTIDIYKGDTVAWVNDEPDKRLKIVSDQQLWNNKSGLLPWEGKEFIYTFNESGIYDIYIEGYSWLNQTIIVGPIDLNPTTNSTVELNSTNSTKTGSNQSIISNITVTKIDAIRPNVIIPNSTNSTTPTQTKSDSTNPVTPVGTTSNRMTISSGLLITLLSSLLYMINRRIK